ncbi:hypothetical protein NHQ30_004490 [Ciborinia camelliae]|nr:hypothetical protein NHQ30_004490 [Ciborinia camelliae]
MDFTVGKSWYKDPKGSSSSEDFSVKSNIKDELAIARSNPTPSRVQEGHVQRLENIASRAEHDQDVANDGVSHASRNPTNSSENLKPQIQKLDGMFPMEMTFDQAMKGYSPPKRSRWADMFETRRFDRMATPPQFFTNPLRRASPLPSIPGAMAGPSTTKNLKSTQKKVPGSEDSKRFREFLARNDGAMPLFMSPTGTHQQFFFNSTRPSQSSSMASTPNNSRPSNKSSVPSNSSIPSNNSTMAGRFMSSVRSSRQSANTMTSTNGGSSLAGGMWSSVNQSFDTQVTDHTRITSVSGSFADHAQMASVSGGLFFQPAIAEHQQTFPGSPMICSQPEVNRFHQPSPEMLPALEYNFNDGMAFAPFEISQLNASMVLTSTPPMVLAPSPPHMVLTPAPMVLTPSLPMVIPPSPIVMDNMSNTLPDLSHLVTKFRPTNMLLREQGMIPDNSRQDTNYEGDENHPDLLNLPDDINCCMWIINIPPEVTPGEFMRILDCGAVAALSMVPPQKGHITQAAKATFKKISGGAELYRRARHKSGLRIRNRKIKVWYNDYGAYEWRGPETRFLEIEAPAVLDERFWQSYFANWCKYIVISIASLPCRKYGFALTRFEFVRIAGQAQTCFQAIQKDEAFLGQVKVQYGTDLHDI